MDPAIPFVIGFDGTSSPREDSPGGNAATLVRLRGGGFRVAEAFGVLRRFAIGVSSPTIDTRRSNWLRIAQGRRVLSRTLMTS